MDAAPEPSSQLKATASQADPGVLPVLQGGREGFRV